ncbi:MAG TPA: cation-translocating P-type ATPase [Bacillota bacterium]|nr:cation-translocating P-type ATPase [Bacillota bacterium]
MDHTTEHEAHSHECGHGCSHSHDISLTAEINAGPNLAHLLPTIFGAIGIIAGLVLQNIGHQSYPIPLLLAAIIAGYPVAKEGFKALYSGRGLDINLLTTIAGLGAILLGEYAEAAAVLTLFSVGEYLEESAGEKSRRSIRAMMELAPLTAHVKTEEGLTDIPAENVDLGDIVMILPGEKIPVDGKVIMGRSSVDESIISGESMPVEKEPGSPVLAGSMNADGSLEVVVTSRAEDTTLSQIIEMIEESQSKKAQTQKTVDRFAKIWTPLMLGLSLVLGIGAPLLLKQEMRLWIYKGLTVLIVSCPCSLVISTPVTIVGAITRAAREGVLIKGGIHLEELGRVKAVAFDKTGTITQNKVVVDKVVAIGGADSDRLLWYAASCESASEHPLARAVVEKAIEQEIDFGFPQEFRAIPGQGAIAVVSEQKVHVGNENLFLSQNVKIPEELSSQAVSFRSVGKTVVFVGVDKEVIGMLALSDALRPEARQAISDLSKQGIESVMISGDDVRTAEAVAREVGIQSVYANLSPQRKLELIREMKAKFGKVAMVGDGINDAPSLAEASVGIALGNGTDIALEAADVVLMRPNLLAIPNGIQLAKESNRLISQNISFSVIVKVLALAMVFAGKLPLWLAVMVDSGAAVLVTFNGLRILGRNS